MKKRILSLSGAIALSLMLASALFAGIRATEFCDSLDLDSSARPRSKCATQMRHNEEEHDDEIENLRCLPGGGCEPHKGRVLNWGGKC